MRARSFLHVSLGILALAAAYHLGARSAGAQAPGNSVVAAWTNGYSLVVTANGDLYNIAFGGFDATSRYVGNVFGGGATPVRQESMGSVKARYR